MSRSCGTNKLLTHVIVVYFSLCCPVRSEAHLQCLWTQWGHGLVCDFWTSALWILWLLFGPKVRNICDTFSVTKTLSYCIYQKSMSVCCKLYFHSLHIKKKTFGNQNLALSCLRVYWLVIMCKHSMCEYLCIQFHCWWSPTVKSLISAIGQESQDWILLWQINQEDRRNGWDQLSFLSHNQHSSWCMPTTTKYQLSKGACGSGGM